MYMQHQMYYAPGQMPPQQQQYYQQNHSFMPPHYQVRSYFDLVPLTPPKVPSYPEDNFHLYLGQSIMQMSAKIDMRLHESKRHR